MQDHKLNLLTNTPSFLHKVTGNEGGTDYILANQDVYEFDKFVLILGQFEVFTAG